MPSKPVDRSTCPVPREFAGKWVAWNSEHSRIVAHGDSMQTLWQLVRAQNIPDPVFEKLLPADVKFVGRL